VELTGIIAIHGKPSLFHKSQKLQSQSFWCFGLYLIIYCGNCKEKKSWGIAKISTQNVCQGKQNASLDFPHVQLKGERP